MVNIGTAAQTKLILVDGIAGSGKSVTGQRLYRAFHLNGYRAEFYHEFHRPHPVLDSPTESVSHWIDQSTTKWRRFVAQMCERDSVILMDGVIFQCGVGDLLERGANDQAILDYACIVEDIVRPLKPILIHLYQTDIETSLQWVRDQRPETWSKRVVTHFSDTVYGRNSLLSGFDLYLQFNRSLRRVSDSLFDRFETTKLAIDNSDRQWNVHHGRMCRFIGLQQVTDTFNAFDYCGNYASGKSHQLCRVEVIDGALVVKGLFEITKQLLPKKGDSVFVQTWPDELTFSRDESGGVISFRSTGPRSRIGDSIWSCVDID